MFQNAKPYETSLGAKNVEAAEMLMKQERIAIMAQDQAVLVSIPGIGRKLADRIIFELKEKVAAAGIAASAASGAIAGGGATEGEVVAALQALGYSLAEARDASHAALVDATIGGTLEDRVKAALRSLLRD